MYKISTHNNRWYYKFIFALIVIFEAYILTMEFKTNNLIISDKDKSLESLKLVSPTIAYAFIIITTIIVIIIIGTDIAFGLQDQYTMK